MSISNFHTLWGFHHSFPKYTPKNDIKLYLKRFTPALVLYIAPWLYIMPQTNPIKNYVYLKTKGFFHGLYKSRLDIEKKKTMFNICYFSKYSITIKSTNKCHQNGNFIIGKVLIVILHLIIISEVIGPISLRSWFVESFENLDRRFVKGFIIDFLV